MDPLVGKRFFELVADVSEQKFEAEEDEVEEVDQSDAPDYELLGEIFAGGVAQPREEHTLLEVLLEALPGVKLEVEVVVDGDLVVEVVEDELQA